MTLNPNDPPLDSGAHLTDAEMAFVDSRGPDDQRPGLPTEPHDPEEADLKEAMADAGFEFEELNPLGTDDTGGSGHAELEGQDLHLTLQQVVSDFGFMRVDQNTMVNIDHIAFVRCNDDGSLTIDLGFSDIHVDPDSAEVLIPLFFV